MGDGWETRRRREPGHDWAVLELGTFGVVSEVVVDTAHFKGNYPDRCSVQATRRAHGTPAEIAAQAEGWPVLLPEVKLQPDTVHTSATSWPRWALPVRLHDLSDGGVSWLRIMGTVSSPVSAPRGRSSPAAEGGQQLRRAVPPPLR